jgi:type IV secretion system protein VirB9
LKLRGAAIALLALVAGQAALTPVAVAQTPSKPVAGPGDPRIKQFMYDPNAIVAIKGVLGYEMTIEFGADERIENVSIGDSLSWQVTPNRKATLLFLKPMSKSASTSMTVVTTQRIYSFVLTAAEGRNDPDAMLRLRFLYPTPPAVATAAPPAPPPPRPEDFNFDYGLSGARNLHPVRVFDDGNVTYFQFDSRNAAPAVFVIGGDGKEEMANTRIQGDYTIADFVAETFILRYGKTQAEVKNRSWSKRPKPKPAPLPQPSRG